jgi:hypothetical protein
MPLLFSFYLMKNVKLSLVVVVVSLVVRVPKRRFECNGNVAHFANRLCVTLLFDVKAKIYTRSKSEHTTSWRRR